MRNPLAVPALCFAGGIAVCRLAGVAPAEAAVCLAAALAGWLVARRIRGEVAARAALWTGSMAAGALAAGLQPPAEAPPLDLAPRRLEGCVVESALLRNDRMQFTLELQPGARIRVSVRPDRSGRFPAPFVYGDRVAMELRLRKLRGFRNPGGFDAAAWMARRGIFWAGTTPRGAAPERLPGSCGAAWRRATERWRAAALARIDQIYPGDAYHGAMMRGLLLGDKSGIRKAWI